MDFSRMDPEEIIRMIKSKSLLNGSEAESPTYKCEECHDTGWLSIESEDGIKYVAKCKCRLAREAEERMKASGLADSLESQTFESFMTSSMLQEKIRNIAMDYVQAVLNGSERKPWFYIGGNPGSGKTHICTAICGELLKKNIGVKYMQWLNESRRLKSAVNDEDFDDYVREYIDVSVLYIDDLLKQKYMDRPNFTEADIKIAFTILNARYLMNKPTIISSEWNLVDQLLDADEGVFSRVYERCKGFTVNIERRRENNFRLTGGVA